MLTNIKTKNQKPKTKTGPKKEGRLLRTNH